MEDHGDVHRSYLLPSILATPEDMSSPRMSGLSPLPLTRAFMDSAIEDDLDYPSEYETSVELDYNSDPYSPEPTPARELEDIFEADRVISFGAIFDMIQHSRTSFRSLENTVLATTENSDDLESIPQDSALSTTQEQSITEQHTPASQVNISTQDISADAVLRGQGAYTSDPSIVTETPSSGSSPPTKPHGTSSRRSRRSANQAFVTDGRGRVVATTDGSCLDANSAWFWAGPHPVIEGTQQTTVDDGAAKEEGPSD